MSPALGFRPAIFAGATKMRMRTERGGRLGFFVFLFLIFFNFGVWLVHPPSNRGYTNRGHRGGYRGLYNNN
ncbi:hypothetical protein HanIR_Chr10g0460661 [Helianthus annuus]|nr:hypothetical protein HanIR_Chr10g0460661 [Helianthus annuus]